MSSTEETADIILRIDSFKSWFNSARFFDKRSTKSWAISFTVGTEKVFLKFVAEVADDNKLHITIGSLSGFDVCFGGTISTNLRMASNFGERVLRSLGKHQVQIFVRSVIKLFETIDGL